MATVFFVVLIDLLGFGIILPLMPFFASRFNASAITIGLLYSVYSFAQLIFSPLWGRWSDRVGRRPVMLISTFGSFLAYLVFGFSNSIGLLFFSRLLAGVMGGNISAAQAYITDVTPAHERSKGMALIGAAFGIGFMIGPMLATFLVHSGFYKFLDALGLQTLALFAREHSFALPGFFAAMLSGTSFLMVLFLLPESIHHADRDADRITRAGIFSKTFWSEIFEQSRRADRPTLFFLLYGIFLLSFAQASLYSAFPLFCKRQLSLSADQVGMQFAAMGMVAIFVQGYLIRKLLKNNSDTKLFAVGSVLMTAGLVLLPFAPSAKILALFLCLMAVGSSLNGPTLNSLISKEAPKGHVGALLGASQGLAALGRTIGPTWGGALFAIHARAPFLVTALFVSSSIWISAKLLRSK